MNPVREPLKRFLAITPYFPPQSHAAVFRMLGTIKYLAKMGWTPYILTVDKNYNYNEDENLLKFVPGNAKIFRTSYIEPSLRGLRMAMGGRNRSFYKLKKKQETGSNSGLIDKKQNRLTRFYQWMLENIVHDPDPYWTWQKSALQTALSLIDTYHIPLVITSFSPFTTLRLGVELKKRRNIKWVADMRDPGVYSSRTASKNPRIYKNQKKLEKMSLQIADTVTILSRAYEVIFKEIHDCGGRFSPVEYIPTGVDEDFLKEIKPTGGKQDKYFIFVGEFIKEYGDDFFAVYRAYLDQSPQDKIKIYAVGHRQINQKNMRPYLRKYQLTEHVRFFDHQPKKELYQMIAGATAFLLIPGKKALWWANYLKLADAVALRKPIIAMVPDPSEARAIIGQTGLGIFLDEDTQKNAQRLMEWEIEAKKIKPHEDYCKQFSLTSQGKSFERLFSHLIGVDS